MATRCCWPPESWPGCLAACSLRPTRSSSFRPRSVASSRLRPSTLIWAIDRFSVMVMCGNSSKCWNTMPTRARSFGRLVFGSPTDMSLTRISPCWKGSRPFTHLISVDLPEPEGPQTTMTSPFSTCVEHSASTWNVPYHLLTFFISIMGMACFPNARWRYAVAAS